MITMLARMLVALALAIALVLPASCAREGRGDRCTPVPSALDRVDRAPTACSAEADCPCGSRCEGGVCTYDCRVDRPDMLCAEGQTCTAAGACTAAAGPTVTPGTR